MTEATGWQTMDSAPDDEKIIATLRVTHVNGDAWWQTDLIWQYDETGEIHRECENGWAWDDYEFWMPLPPPPPTIEQADR